MPKENFGPNEIPALTPTVAAFRWDMMALLPPNLKSSPIRPFSSAFFKESNN
jgi:hypothetical protein